MSGAVKRAVVDERRRAAEPAQENDHDEARPRAANENELPPILTVEELAKLLRLNRKTAYAAVARGEIPGARRVGRTVRICRDTVLDWLGGHVRVSRDRRK